MLSKRKTECGNQLSDALTVSNDRSGQNVDDIMMPTENSTDNLGQDVLKAESGDSFDNYVLYSAGLSSSPETPLEDCLYFEGCIHGVGSSNRGSAGHHLRPASSDRTYGDVDDSCGGQCADDVDGLRNVRTLLMHQIRSFIMDPDIDIFSKSQSHMDDSSLKQGVHNNELNLELKEVAVPLSLENICTADSGILDTEATTNESQSYNHPNTVVDYSKSERSSSITTDDWCKCTSESDNNLFEFDISKGTLSEDEREDFDSVLQLLLHIRDICFEKESLSEQESVDVKQFEGSEERNLFTAEHLEVMDDVCSPAATLPSDDSPDKNREDVKDHARSLWKEINEIFERKQFSSAVILGKHLETVETIKSVTDSQCKLQLQQKQGLKRNSKEVPINVKLKNTKSLEQFIVLLSTRANSNMTYLSDKLIQWQDFNEDRADLGYELAKEQDSLESIETRINSEYPNPEAEHDLKFVEEMEENYCERLRKLRRCNRDLEGVGLLDDKTCENHRSQLGTLANQLQYIKMSCSSLRKRLHLPDFPLTNDCLQSGELKVYSQADDDDDEAPASVSLLKMLLLLMLIVLFLVVFFFFLEPRWYNQVNSFRLPVFYHLRHVGTFPPV